MAAKTTNPIPMSSLRAPDALRGIDNLVARVSQIVERHMPRRKRMNTAAKSQEPVGKSA